MLFCCFCFSSDSDEEKSRKGKSPKAEFKDEEETVTTKHIHITQATETTTTRHKRTANPSKTIDLGAAAHYTGDKASPEQNVAAHTAQSTAKVRYQERTREHDFGSCFLSTPETISSLGWNFCYAAFRGTVLSKMFSWSFQRLWNSFN